MAVDDTATGFWRTVWLLAKLARSRSRGRSRRQRQLMNNRSGREATDWGSLAIIFSILFFALVHGLAALSLIKAVETASLIESTRAAKPQTSAKTAGLIESKREAKPQASAQGPVASESAGRLVVSRWFYTGVTQAEERAPRLDPFDDDDVQRRLGEEVHDTAERLQVPDAQVRQRIESILRTSGSKGLIPREPPKSYEQSDTSTQNEESILTSVGIHGLGAVTGSLVFLWWFSMLVCQGEGVDLDVQRRRHPMWEWLLSHPVRPGAVFMAEMLTPLAANPIFWTSPLFVGILYGNAYGLFSGMTAAIIAGIPLAVAAACVGKAFEIAALLRLPPRSRGAVIGILGWFGFVSMLAMLFLSSGVGSIISVLSPVLTVLSAAPWPWLAYLLGLGFSSQPSILLGILSCWTLSVVLIAFAVSFSARSIRRGIAGAFGNDRLPARQGKPAAFGKYALFKKEALWFARDRSALVQAVLIPVSLAGFQLINLRGLLRHAENSWNYLAGAAIFFGTYFLFILGPKSLASDGSALWLALTWPRGLEGLLKAKAWLWAMIATVLVSAVLIAGCFMFPHDAWKICLVGIAWYFFAQSMADKSVTLVTVVSESGEAQKIPTGRRWAAQLGMVTFALGVGTGQWHLAVVGIVYSWITAAAMWENLRARLPYLFDPWSERLPEPPTLMHAMVSISVLIECTAVISSLFYASGAKEAIPIGLALGYAVSAIGVSVGVADFLAKRGVAPRSIWVWGELNHHGSRSWLGRFVGSNVNQLGWLAWGIGGGLLLGLLADGYVALARQIPFISPAFEKANQQMHAIPGLHTAYAIVAIGFAPFAEEFLFRGLLYRTLDRHWGGWKAIAGAAAFFAIYHPPLSWLPVFMLGAANCILFKRSHSLTPAVLLHMTYNAIVTIV